MKKYIFGLFFIVGLFIISPVVALAVYNYGITPPVEPSYYTLTVNVVNTGKDMVYSSPAGISNCVGSCSAKFLSGTKVNLYASASSGAYFAGFGADCTGNDVGYVTMTSNKTCSATFHISSVSPVEIMPTGEFPDGLIGEYYISGIQATKGTTPYKWSKSAGTLPPGISLMTNEKGEGILSGKPTTVGIYTFTVKVTDAKGTTDSHQLTIKIEDNDLTPSLKIIAPNGGEKLTIGSTFQIKNTYDTQTNPMIGYVLYKGNNNLGSPVGTWVVDDQVWKWNVGQYYEFGGYNIKTAAPGSDYYIGLSTPGFSNSQLDRSDGPFTIKSETTVDLGCSYGSIYSSTTGQLCPVKDSGCSYGSIYSSTTGQLCPKSSVNSTPINNFPTKTLFNQTISFGARNEIVRSLQNELIKRGLLPFDSNTGFFGLGTKAALCKYQVSKGLISASDVACGYNLGVSTRAALNAEL